MNSNMLGLLDAGLGQPYVQLLLGGLVALLLRGAFVAWFAVVSSISRRVKQQQLQRLMERLALFKFYERNPTVLTARTTQIQLHIALQLFLFCCLWFAAGNADAQISLGIATAQIVLAGAMAWSLVDVYSLVQPLAHFRAFETGVQQQIASIKKRLSQDRKLDEEISRRNEELERYAEALDESAAIPTSEQPPPPKEPLTDPPQGVDDRPAIREEPAHQEAPAEEPVRERVAPTAQRRREAQPVAAKRSGDGEIYQSLWIVGHVQRWPDGGYFGFLESSDGETFFAPIQSMAGLEPLSEGQEVLFQAVDDTPNRRAILVCGLGSYAQGRVNGLRGNTGFITIEDGMRGFASIYFRLPVGKTPDFAIGKDVGFVFGRNILGPTAENIDPNPRSDWWAKRRDERA
jgi:cold shock CspA family protein